MTLREISERWHEADIRVACNRHLAATPDDVRALAAELELGTEVCRAWLLDRDQSIYSLGFSSKSIETLENYNKSKKKNKSGRKPKPIRWELIRRIKDYGVEKYCDNLLREYRQRNEALRASAVARSRTNS